MTRLFKPASWLFLVLLTACGEGGDIIDGDAVADGKGDAGLPAIYRSSRPVDHSASLPLCPQPVGTMGMPEPFTADFTPDSSLIIEALSAIPPGSLPNQVHLRTNTETYNRVYWFALRDGRIWFKSNTDVTGIENDWAAVPMPECLINTLVGISADDDELIAIRQNGDIYGLDNIHKDPGLFNWTSRWGPPVWLGTGYHVPEDYLAWSWTVISPAEDVNWTDPAGNQHPIGQGKVSHVWLLSDGGQRYTYIDPWLPKDESYEMCGPNRGRFRTVNLSSSGSTIFTIGAYGDMYTRHYDFDLSGADNVFFTYSYEDQTGVSNPAIQLPVFDWVKQPKVPGEITSEISLHKVGQNMVNRIMRVAGRDASGQTGYWEKDITELDPNAWLFIPTEEPLTGQLLENPPQDSSLRDNGPDEDGYYARNMQAIADIDQNSDLTGNNDWAGELLDFNVYCSPAVLRIHTAPGESMDLVLHSADVITQTTPRARGLNQAPRGFNGNVEIPLTLFERLGELTTRQQQFIAIYLNNQRYTDMTFSGVTGEINLGNLGLFSSTN